MVVDESTSRPQLFRMADIVDDKLTSVIINEDARPIFENRDRLFQNDGPHQIGAIGIWHWTAIPNAKDPTNDFIQSSYKNGLYPIEIIDIRESASTEEAIAHLFDGLKANIQSDYSYLLVFKRKNEMWHGFFCSGMYFENCGGNVKIKDSIMTLNEYVIRPDDVIKIPGNELVDRQSRKFYKLFNIGKPFAEIPLYSPRVIVQNKIIKRANWKVFKEFGASKREWQAIKSFFTEIDTPSLYEEIARDCVCSIETAQKYVSESISSAETVFSELNLENEVLSSIIERNPLLHNRCEEIVFLKWETENSQKIEEAKKILSAQNHLIEVAKSEKQKIIAECKERVSALDDLCAAKQMEIEDMNSQFDNLKIKICEQEIVGVRTIESVREKLGHARSDVASFLAEISVYMPFDTNFGGNSSTSSNSCQRIEGISLPLNCLSTASSYKEQITFISDELVEAGVADELREILATYLYAATYINSNLLLAGPAADSIADALSCGLYGMTAERLICDGQWDTEIVQQVLRSDNKVIIIENPFAVHWIDRLPQYILSAKQMIILTTPFSEDIAIEPKGLCNYVLPLFTDYFVDHKPTNCWAGAIKANKFQDLPLKDIKPFSNKVLNQLGLSKYAKKQIQSVLAAMKSMLEDKNKIYEYLCGLLPLAYMTDSIEIIKSEIEQTDALSDKEKAIIDEAIGGRK